MADLSFIGITALAGADAVNPCVLAVLTMILITLLTNNPENRKKVLFSGLAFSGAIFLGYFFYGYILINLFESFAYWTRENSKYIFNGLAILSMIIGALNIKDYLWYKKGGFATEMPLSLRPKVKLITEKMTNPTGCFFIGIFVTLFLLPCTAGPYIIASGLLSKIGFVASIPWLIYYNFIFILPMIIITFAIYGSFTSVEKLSRWNKINIKRLHLIAGILLFLIGFSLLMGWI